MIPRRKRSSAARGSRKQPSSLWTRALAVFLLSVCGHLMSDTGMRLEGLLIPPWEQKKGWSLVLGSQKDRLCWLPAAFPDTSVSPHLCTWISQQLLMKACLLSMLVFCYRCVSRLRLPESFQQLLDSNICFLQIHLDF